MYKEDEKIEFSPKMYESYGQNLRFYGYYAKGIGLIKYIAIYKDSKGKLQYSTWVLSAIKNIN